MVIVYNPCLEGRELVSWLLYTNRVWKGGSWYHGYCIQPVFGREGVGIMVIVCNSCVEEMKRWSWYHGYCIQPVCGKEGVGIMVIVYNPCVKRRKLVSWLLYITRV